MCGSPGIGKSTFARSILRNALVEERFGCRRYEVQCDDLGSAEDLIRRIALQWFDVIEPDLERLKSIVLEGLAKQKCAILVDNFETLMPSTEAKIRRESREWLRKLASKKALWLIVAMQGREPPEGLTWDRDQRVELETLSIDKARELFCQWSGMSSHAIDPHLDKPLDEVDCVPHAVKLLACMARGCDDLEDLLIRWRDERTRIFPKPNILREETVKVTYEFAFQCLDRKAQDALRVLAWLPGGVARADLPEVLPEGRRADYTLYNAAVAYRKGHPYRLKMLKPLRDYVVDEHPATDEETKTANGHYLALAAKGNSLGSADDEDTILRIAAEYSNVLPGLQAALKNGKQEAIQAACGLGRFSAGTAIGRSESYECVKSAWEMARVYSEKFDEAKCLRVLGDLEYARSAHDEAEKLYNQALVLFDDIQDKGGEAGCLWQLGDIARRRQNDQEAERCYKQALQLYRDAEDGRGAAWCFKGLGDVAHIRKEYENAEGLYNFAMECFRRAQDRRGEAGCLWELGDIALMRDDHGKAETLYRKGLGLFTEAQIEGGKAWCIKRLGDIAYARGAFRRRRSFTWRRCRRSGPPKKYAARQVVSKIWRTLP